MRDKAGGSEQVRHLDGVAENLPCADHAARGVVAATAAHWFDRPGFYREAARVLVPGGLLAIVEYVRDEHSPAARAVLDFLNSAGDPRAYTRPDYATEIGALTDFGGLDVARKPVTFRLQPAAYAGLALSSSHARAIVGDIGEAAAISRLEEIARSLADDDGKVPFGYVFQSFIAVRA